MIAIKDFEMPSCCGECNLTACKGYDEPWNYCCSVTLTDINLNDTTKPSDCPLVDIEERKVGEWCKQNDDYFDWYECSECGYGSEGEMQYSSKYDVRTKYCPNCGAEMVGTENG